MDAFQVREEDPPPVANGRQGGGRRPGERWRWQAALARVAAGGGKWFRVGEYVTVTSARGTGRDVQRRLDREGRFEFTTRTIDGKGVLFARLKVPTPA